MTQRGTEQTPYKTQTTDLKLLLCHITPLTYSGVPRRGLEPLPVAYDLRNKRVRMRQNMVFSIKNTKNFLSADPSPSGKGIPLPTPHPLSA